MHPSTSPHSADSSLGFDSGSPAFLFALSMQALSVHEMGAHFDLDYLVACILQTLFLLHDGGGGKETAGREISGEAENEGGEESLLGIKAKGKAKSKETLGNTIFPLVRISFPMTVP
jgi:hypothetical protein